MALEIVGTSPGYTIADTPANDLTVTFTCTSAVGFQSQDIVYFAVNLILGPMGSATTDADGHDWYIYEFTNIRGGGSQTAGSAGIVNGTIPAASVGASTYVVNFPDFVTQADGTGGIIATEGFVLRGSPGYDSEHTGESNNAAAQTSSDIGVSAWGTTPKSASMSAHSGETAATGYQIAVFYASKTRAATGNTIEVTVPGVDFASASETIDDGALAFGATFLAEGVATETAPIATGSWRGGGSGATGVFRAVSRYLLNNPPVANFTLTVTDALTMEVDVTTATDYEDTNPKYWQVSDWGDSSAASAVQTWATNKTLDHVYSAPGLYVVTVYVWDTKGASAHNSLFDTVTSNTPEPSGPQYLARLFRRHDLPFDLRTIRLGGE